MTRFRVIDADGHCIEHDSQIAEYGQYVGRSLKTADRSCFSYFPSLDGWFRATFCPVFTRICLYFPLQSHVF